MKLSQKDQISEGEKPPEKVGLGHARKHQKNMEKAKKLWKGGGC